mgnify:FL=1
MVKISVIIPVYNSEKYLERCLKSVIYQTYENLEIICVNDGSEDNSLNILEDFKKKDERVKIFSKENTGLSDARNHGIDKATGEYISFVDSDDFISLTLYDDFVKILNHTGQNVDIYNFNAYAIRQDKKSLFDDLFFDIKDWKNHTSLYAIHTIKDSRRPFSGNFGAYNKIYKTDFLKNNNIWFESRVIFEDQPFYIKTFLRANSIIVNEKPYYMYFKRTENNIMNTLSNKTFDIFKVINIVDGEVKNSKFYEYLKYALLQHKYTTLSYMFFETVDDKKEEFYDEMKKILLDTKNENFDIEIASKLRGYPIYQDILALDKDGFFEKYKNKIIKER